MVTEWRKVFSLIKRLRWPCSYTWGHRREAPGLVRVQCDWHRKLQEEGPSSEVCGEGWAAWHGSCSPGASSEGPPPDTGATGKITRATHVTLKWWRAEVHMVSGTNSQTHTDQTTQGVPHSLLRPMGGSVTITELLWTKWTKWLGFSLYILHFYNTRFHFITEDSVRFPEFFASCRFQWVVTTEGRLSVPAFRPEQRHRKWWGDAQGTASHHASCRIRKNSEGTREREMLS